MTNRVVTSPLHRRIDLERQWSRNMRIVAAYKRGDAVAEIVSRYGVSRSQVLRLARSFGEPKRVKWRVSPEERAAAMAEYVRGVPIATIAAEYGVSQAWVSSQAKKLGISRYRSSTPPKTDSTP